MKYLLSIPLLGVWMLWMAACSTPATPASAPATSTTRPTIPSPTSVPTTAPPTVIVEVSPTNVVTATAAASAAHYAWLEPIPEQKHIQPEVSEASETSFLLTLADQTNPQDYIEIRGQEAAPDANLAAGPCQQPVQVRGQAGVVCMTGGGASVQWQEGGWRYSVGGGLTSPEQAVAYAESLVLIDQAEWLQRLATTE